MNTRIGFWLSADWDHIGCTPDEMEALWPRWLELLRAVRATGVQRVGFNISGGPNRVRILTQRFAEALPRMCPTCGTPGPSIWVGVCTAELSGNARLDADADIWIAFRETLVWLHESLGTPPLLDFEWSLIDWLDGKPEATLDLPQFARNAQALRGLGFPVRVYPSQYAGASERRDAFQAVLNGALSDGMIVMGTTYHSPDAAGNARNVHVRQLDRALSVPHFPQEQIIVGPAGRPWFTPQTLPVGLKAVPIEHELHVWPQFNFVSGDPSENLMPQVLEGVRTWLSTPEAVDADS